MIACHSLLVTPQGSLRLLQPFNDLASRGHAAYSLYLTVDDKGRCSHHSIFANFLDISYMIDAGREIQFADRFQDLPFESITIRTPRSKDLYF